MTAKLWVGKVKRSAEGEDFEAEYRVLLPDGSSRWVYDRAKLGWHNERRCFVGACTDITEKRLAQAALIRSEKLASVGRLAATVAHEINNPLEAATNLLFLAMNVDSSSPQLRSYLAQAEEQLARVAEMTRQTLGFYREHSRPVPTRMGEIIAQLTRVFAQKTRNKGIRVELDVRQDPEISAVPGEMRQVFTNLLGNAIDAVSSGGVIKIRVSKRSGRHGSKVVRVTVADSGPGIPAAVRARIFEPFFTTKKDIGTGLGLWVVNNIVDKHGGRIRVRSSTRPGATGTVVSVSCPIR